MTDFFKSWVTVMCFYDNSSCSPCSEALSSDHCSQMRQQYHCISNSFTKISWNVVVVDCKTSQHTLSALYGDNINDMSAVTGVDGALCRCMNGHFISQKKQQNVVGIVAHWTVVVGWTTITLKQCRVSMNAKFCWLRVAIMCQHSSQLQKNLLI